MEAYKITSLTVQRSLVYPDLKIGKSRRKPFELREPPSRQLLKMLRGGAKHRSSVCCVSCLRFCVAPLAREHLNCRREGSAAHRVLKIHLQAE
ncbi:hypothetical protein SFRURICE_001774 [Spodoptera frugiperda]|nr:hypothetical protein SFRURICE_001774 [Spodoptera frugiperda]